MSNILNLLSFDGFISVNKTLIRKLGLEEACVVGFLATMHEYHASKDFDGWFYVKYDLTDQDEDVDKNRRNTAKYQLGMSKDKFIKITKKLEKINIIFTKKKGVPALKFYKFDADVICQLLLDENAIKSVNKGTHSAFAKHESLLSQNTTSSCRKTRMLYKEKINKKESISLLANISPQDVTLDLIKKEAKRREKDIKSFIKDELGKKISGNEYKELFENFCNNYWEWIQRKEIKSYTATFEKFISEENSYKSNEPVQQGFVSPKSKKPPPPLLSLGLPDTSTDFIKDSQEWQNLLKEKFDEDVYDKWIKCLIPHRKEGEKVIFSVETKFVRDWVIRQYQTKIQEFLGFDIVILSTEP
tara:strand:+ start:17605 stop:18678 length:1074 start_codon:yes stop_codon:yes gene_type:complete